MAHTLCFMYLNSFTNFVIHMVYLVPCILTMYLASIVNKTIMGCCLELQEMAPPPIMNTNPMVDLLSSRSLAQFRSQYLTMSWGGNPPNHNLNCKVPCKCWWLMYKRRCAQSLSTSMPKKKCKSPRSFISNF